MTDRLFSAAYPYMNDVLALPVDDLDRTVAYYSQTFGLREVERTDSPPTVIMERDGVQLGFAVNGGVPSQEGAAILVTDIRRAHREVEASGQNLGDVSTNERDGKRFEVFSVVAPDSLCFYFHQAID